MILTQMQIFHITIIGWPSYHPTVAILLDLVLVIGLIASLMQHLKMLIFFSWLSALTFLLIFFGNTVSSQYQSDLIVPLSLPPHHSSRHHPHQQQHGTDSSSSPPPPPPPPPLQSSHRTKSSSSPLPLATLSTSTSAVNKSHCYVPKNDPQFHAV
ncbi:hypothetical protein BLA29_002452 [Euroglyphus maynei]|uniref:Uncharacterized protein n=1 Tax=Euroglyphus maynei TaxID=6958 RepID=A0A1Y3AQ52_EURMA|nr:hypothetical protein BLA29_002452 [Euroglyphus maynei]